MKKETLDEVAERCFEEMKVLNPRGGIKEFIRMAVNFGAKYQQEQDKNSYSEKDMRKAHSIGWVTRERFDDLSPEIIYPKGLDYEEKQDYAFNLWFNKFKNK